MVGYRGAAEVLNNKKRPKIPTLNRTSPSILGPCLGRPTFLCLGQIQTLFWTDSPKIAVPQHFHQKRHKLTDIELIPLELINSKREFIRRAKESFYIDNAKSMQPCGINREDDRSFFIF